MFVKKPRILVIDDEQDVCVYLRHILEKTGKFEVWATTSPSEGIYLATSKHPDLILLDIIMPEMDGTQVAEQLHDNRSTQDILIVFVSVLASREDVDKNKGIIGGHPFIPKAVDKEEFIARIESLLLEASIPE